MRCLNCDYLLNHLPLHRCPECGRRFRPDDHTTYKYEPYPTLRLYAAIIGLYTGVFLIAFLLYSLF